MCPIMWGIMIPMKHAEIDALITNRIATFYSALLERGQISGPDPTTIRPSSHCIRSVHTPQCEEPEDRAPR